ncbi:MAG: hypothetical protein ACETWG_09025, partial [Candidatus Neomarinimicrobiota bacterium]
MKQLKPVSLVVGLCMLILSAGIAQEPIFEREIIVMFRPGVIELSPGVIEAKLSEVAITIPAIKNALERRNVEAVLKVFPDFELDDTLGISRTGERVK